MSDLINQPTGELTFAEVKQNPLLQKEHVDSVISLNPAKSNDYVLAPYMPLVEVNQDKVVMDIQMAKRGGMTPAVTMRASSPEFGTYARSRREFDAAEFREKVTLYEDELYDLRDIGTLDGATTAQRLLDRKYMDIQERLRQRMEWMRRQVIFDGNVNAPLWKENGTMGTLSVDYFHPDYLKPSAGTPWSTVATAEPLDDLQLWLLDFDDHSNFRGGEYILPHRTLYQIGLTQSSKDIRQYNFGAYPGTQGDINNVLLRYVGIPIRESNARLEFATALSADVSAGATSIVVDELGDLKAGDKIILKRVTGQLEPEQVEVASVVAATRTVNLAAPVQLASGFEEGSLVRYHRFTIPEGKILLMGRFGGDMSPLQDGDRVDRQPLAQPLQITSTLSGHRNLMDRRPGMFTKQIDKITNGDPGHIEQIIGIRMLPQVNYNECWAVCDYL